MKSLTVLSFGGGQDSTALLWLYIMDESFRKKYAPGDFIVICSDTGDEHDYTYKHIRYTQSICQKHGIRFYHLTNDMGFHTPAWPDLISPQLRGANESFKPTMVQLGTKSCTINLKINPIYKFLDEHINEAYGYGFPVQPGRGCLKRAIKRFGEENGRIKVLIGFAAGEEKRVKKSLSQQAKDHVSTSFWKHIERDFPLVDLQMTRESCQAYIVSVGGDLPMPSNCVNCPYMSGEELLWLWINDRTKFDRWVEIEKKKLDRFSGHEKNHGVFNSKKTLTMKLEEMQKKYANWEPEKLRQYLNTYKMSHGCTSGGY